MNTRVKVVFPATHMGQATWPHIDYDVPARAKEVLALLEQALPTISFEGAIYYTRKEAQADLGDEQYDGYLVYMTGMWKGITELYCRRMAPVIIADELYAGSGEFLRVMSLVKRDNLPVIGVGSSDFQDIVGAVRLFEVMKRMRESKILVVAEPRRSDTEGADTITAATAIADATRAIFGTKIERIGAAEVQAYYDAVDDGEARKWRDKWMSEAVKVVEPTAKEIEGSARMYLALKHAMQDAQADAVTVDCLGLFYTGRLPAYPCLSFFQLNNEGLTGVCEADVESTLTQLLFRYLNGRPGYVSDPVIDTASDQIIYAHCVATNRVFGPDGPPNPYMIRSHAEDLKGASIQSFMPLGKMVTTAKVSVVNKAFSIHTGRAVGNIYEDKACRTKLAVTVDAQKLIDNYHFELFSWHRVSSYGDTRKAMMDLATLYGLDIVEEDR